MSNYCNDLWPAIYDQYNQGRHKDELRFYSSALATRPGSVLEVACGTGMILLPLLEQGLEIYGFDLSPQMLTVLREKAATKGIKGIEQRITVQDMTNFHYDIRFGTIIIPARSFLHLTTQASQLQCLHCIHDHLSIGGQVLLNFFTPSLSAILSNTSSTPQWHNFDTLKHRQTNKDVRVSYSQQNDCDKQVQHILWKFEIDGKMHESNMQVSWIYRKEFELFARLAKLRIVDLYSGFDRAPYNGTGEMVWVLERE